MATNHTVNYNLPQWEATDPVVRKDFNDAFEDIDKILAKKGNCRIEVGTYVGTGEKKVNTLTFKERPLLVVVMGTYTMIVPGTVESGRSVPVFAGGNGNNGFSWSENTLTWGAYNNDLLYQQGEAGVTYTYLSFYAY